MIYFIIGIIAGWLTPRPRFLAAIEAGIWTPIKARIPQRFRWWG